MGLIFGANVGVFVEFGELGFGVGFWNERLLKWGFWVECELNVCAC
jgi:hypothetical protein